jgi:hypothetical protein
MRLANSDFVVQSKSMHSNWAADHLQVIRTLMERSALYRRALAPIMIFVGLAGLAAAGLGWALRISQPVSFVAYWYGVGLIGLGGAFVLVRRQAWKQAEPFWSPPTRRVAQAFLPPLTAGFVLGVVALFNPSGLSPADPPAGGCAPLWTVLVGLPASWVILYGCALHAAGFFMQRGIRLFGWGLMLGGCGCLLLGHRLADAELLCLSYGLMGALFGATHLAYGIYLHFTEPRGNAT